jgi:NET1-associated nuclear protein 1 (U3 small nucleolar RNA-associated protein 17)
MLRTDLQASASGQVLATIDRHTALVWTADKFPKAPLALTHTKPLTCAALSAKGDALAVGDATGRILLWRGVHAALLARASGQEVDDMDQPAAEQLRARATVHWHAEPVCCMAFSPDDAYLLSGGHEGVLVIWDLSSGRRTYLPRLGTCLRHISPCSADPSRVAVSLSDNLVRMVDLAAMQVCSSIRGVCSAPAAPTPACMAVQPATGHLALLGGAGSLQFFDPVRNRHVDRLWLSSTAQGRPPTSDARVHADKTKALPATHAVFTTDGQCLVTIEEAIDTAGGAVSLAKFWERHEGHSSSGYALADRRGNPCSFKGTARSLALHPRRTMAAIALGGIGLRLVDLPKTGPVTVISPPDIQGKAAALCPLLLACCRACHAHCSNRPAKPPLFRLCGECCGV